MRRTPISFLVAFLAVTALLAGCSDDGGNDDDTQTELPTSEELEALLPTADDIGGGYADLVPSGTPRPRENAVVAFTDACPALADLDLGGTDLGDDAAAATFVTDDDREIAVVLDPSSELSEDRTADLVADVNECATLNAAEGDDVPTVAATSDDFGDFGMTITLGTEFELFGVPLEINIVGRTFSVDGVGVTIVSTSGFEQSADGSSTTSVPGDDDQIPEIAALVEERIEQR